MSTGASTYAPREALALVHHHPGGLRVRADAFRRRDGGDPTPSRGRRPRSTRCRRVAGRARRPGPGDLLVEYEPGLVQPEAILRYITDAAGLDMPSPPARAAPDVLLQPKVVEIRKHLLITASYCRIEPKPCFSPPCHSCHKHLLLGFPRCVQFATDDCQREARRQMTHLRAGTSAVSAIRPRLAGKGRFVTGWCSPVEYINSP